MRGNNQTLVGYFLGAELFLGTRAHAMIAGHLDDLAAGTLQVVIDRRFPLEQAGEAHAYIESRLKLTAGGSNPVMILALVDSVKFVGLGIGNGKIGMATFNFNSFQWEWLAGGTISVTTSAVHTYRLGKFGATTSTVYVDGVEKFSTANSLLPDNFLPQYSQFVGSQAAHLSTFFGPTAQDANAVAVVSYVNYAFHATPKP